MENNTNEEIQTNGSETVESKNEEQEPTVQTNSVNNDEAEVKSEPAKEEVVDVAEKAANAASKHAENPMFKAFVSKKLYNKAAENLVELCEKLNMTTEDFDDRAVELLASFNLEQSLFIIKELDECQLYGVHNKPQYLMSVMRNFKDRVRSVGSVQAMSTPLIPGPKTENIKAIIERTNYSLEVTVGQRKFHNPPDHDSSVEPSACIYIGQIPRELYEDELIPHFETIGKIFDLRLMMDPSTGKSRGYAFLIYCNKEHAQEAAKKFDGFEIQPGKALKVNVSVANTRLFIGNIPKSKSKEEILEELQKHAEGVSDVIIYANPEAGDARKNRGFCFVDFVDHKAASDAKRRISQGKIRPWNNDLVVDWAEQQDEPDDEVMATVKVVYVKNLKESVTEERLKELFEKHGEVERAKKIRDYAFIHFKERSGALAAIEALKGTVLDDLEIEISLAKPQGDMKQKKKLAQKRGPSGPGAGSLATRRSGPNYGGADYYSPGGGGGGYGGGRGRNAGPAYPKYPVGGGYGGGPSYGGPGGYDPYGYPPAPYYPPVAGGYDPYGPPAYDAYSPGGGYGGGYGGAPIGYGGKPKGGFGGGRGGGGGGRGRNGGGRGKRPSGVQGGPASKRPQDFSADVSMNMF